MSNKQLNKMILFKNTIMLYLLVFSSYLFGFITVPYQTRILGPNYYGRVGFALAFMTYFRVLIDFGFILSATEEVSKNRDNKIELSKIVVSVNIIKIILSTISLLILVILCLNISRFREEWILYILTFISVVTAGFIPDYLYRGLENMKTITIRTVLIQFFFMLMIFIFLKNKEDYYLIPLFTAIGNIGAIIGVYIHSIKVIGIKYIRVKPKYIWDTFKRSSFFFYSRIASTIYSVTNTVILGMIYPVGSNVVGLYTSADKLVSTAKSGFSPIADSLYPYMVKNKDFKLVRKILLIIMPPVIIGCIVVGIYSEIFVVFLLGEEFRNAGEILRILMPIVAITPIVYIIGFPVLTPMGLSKHGNLSIIYASFFQIIAIGILLLTKRFSVITLCFTTVITEFILFSYRIVVIWLNKSTFINN